MDTLLEYQNAPKLIKEEMETLSSLVTITEMFHQVGTVFGRVLAIIHETEEFYSFAEPLRKQKKKEHFLTSFCKASVNLIPKADKNSTREDDSESVVFVNRYTEVPQKGVSKWNPSNSLYPKNAIWFNIRKIY